MYRTGCACLGCLVLLHPLVSAAQTTPVEFTPVSQTLDSSATGTLSKRAQLRRARRLERRKSGLSSRRTRRTRERTRTRTRRQDESVETRQTARNRARTVARRSRRSSRSRSSHILTQKIAGGVLSAINAARQKSDVSVVSYNFLLEKAAQGHADEMHEHNYLNGINRAGQRAEDRIQATGYAVVDAETCDCKSWGYRLAEIFARASAQPAKIVEFWLQDTATRKQLLSEQFTEVGVGKAGNVWVVSLGNVTIEKKVPFTPEQRREFAKEVLQLTNEERSREGLAALTRNEKLDLAALLHAKDMDKHKYFAHENLKGQLALDRIRITGYLAGARGYAVGENIARGQDTPADVMEGWMNSPGHRKNILSPNFSEIGIGLYGEYWAQNFGDVTK